MTDDEIKEMKRENAALLHEKAEAVAKWHEEVRSTLASLSIEVAGIKANINTALQLQAALEKLEKRIKVIEDFKMRATAYMMGAFAIVALFWKVLDKIWK